MIQSRCQLRMAVLLGMLSVAGTTSAATFQLTLYGTPYPNPGVQSNISDYTNVFTGTFEIADAARTPNNLILFGAPDFLNFDVSFTTHVRTYDFNLHDPLTEGQVISPALYRKESVWIPPDRHKGSIHLPLLSGMALVSLTTISGMPVRGPR